MSDRVYAKDAGPNDMVAGGYIPQAGNADEYSVAGWRLNRPERDNACCIDCLFCWVYCPDTAVVMGDHSVKGMGFDLVHCKGCGVCAEVCPKDCIAMHAETEYAE